MERTRELEIVVHDTPALLRDLFVSEMRAQERFVRARPLLHEGGAIHQLLQPVWNARDRFGYPVMAAVQADGHEAVFGQQLWGLFNPTRTRELSAWAFDRFRETRLLEPHL